jgi:hypothetical protein
MKDRRKDRNDRRRGRSKQLMVDLNEKKPDWELKDKRDD